MKGIQFVVDEHGEKQAVLIDLNTWGEVWEDMYDVITAEARQGEPDDDWESVKARLAQDGGSE